MFIKFVEKACKSAQLNCACYFSFFLMRAFFGGYIFMEQTESGLVFDLPRLTIPTSITADSLPWILGATLLLLLIALRYKVWRGWKRRLNVFRRTEKPLLKVIGWLSLIVSPLWVALIFLVVFSYGNSPPLLAMPLASKACVGMCWLLLA